jgi:hypothetical protein
MEVTNFLHDVEVMNRIPTLYNRLLNSDDIKKFRYMILFKS